MVNLNEVQETNRMIEEENLDVRTITMGISLLDCAHSDCSTFRQKIYDKITRKAENLVKTGEEIQKKFGVPIVNKRISVTPVSICSAACDHADFPAIAQTLDKAAAQVGVNFIGGFSALVQKGMTCTDEALYRPGHGFASSCRPSRTVRRCAPCAVPARHTRPLYRTGFI